MKFAVIDVETTGLSPTRDKITEIGIVIIEDGFITDEFSSLINPGVRIPDKIISLTGISNEMVKTAVSFEDIADTIEEITSDAIIIGHHVNFDYSFLMNKMKYSGYSFNRKTLCTAELCRYLHSQLSSFSLSSLCRHFNIINSNPHRALPDAKATAEIFLKLWVDLDIGFIQKLFKRSNGSSVIPGHLKNIIQNKLPSRPGVYYFMGHNGKPFYIGKAAKIKSRVLSHFRGEGNSLNILSLGLRIKEIRFRETGNEMLAMLVEDHEIRHYWPKLNSAQKKNTIRFGVVFYRDQNNNWRINIASTGKLHCFVAYFHQYDLATEFIREKVKTYNLDESLCGLYTPGSERVDNHNFNFQKMIDEMKDIKSIEIYTNQGRTANEKSFIWIENGLYKGYGFIDSERICTQDEFSNQLTLQRTSITSEAIIRKLRENQTPDFKFTLRVSEALQADLQFASL